MRTFKDSKGRELEVCVNMATVNRVRSNLKIDLTDVQAVTDKGTPILAALSGLDIFLMGAVLYLACKPSADRLLLTEEEFAEVLDGNAVAAAHKAFMEEWQDFSRSLGRADLTTAIQKATAMVHQGVKGAEAVNSRGLDLATRHIEAQFQSAMQSLESSDSPLSTT